MPVILHKVGPAYAQLLVCDGLEAQNLYSASSELATAAEGNLPTEIHLLPLGEWNGYRDPNTGELRSFKITKDHIDAAVAYNERRKALNPARDLVIDFEHQTLKDVEAPAAGWIDKLFARADGLYAHIREWTEEAKEYLRKKAYRYISPVFAFDAVDKVTGDTISMAVFNAGLTNEPFFDELKPIISKHIIGKGPVMDDLLERLRYFLQLPITATASEILAELGKLSTQIQGVIAAGSKEGATAKGIFDFIAAIKKNYAEVLQSLGLKPEATVEEAKAIIAAKGDTSGFVAKADYQKLLDQIAGRELDELIAKALVEGKITPATKDQMKAWAMKDRKSFDEYLGKVAAYSAVPLGQIKIATDKLGRGAGLTERDLEIAAKFGLTEDQLKKHNPAAD